MKLLKFEAPWCTKCHQVTKMLDELSLPFPIEKVNIDDNLEAAMEYGIRGIPHMILLDENNNIIKRIGGVLKKEQLQEELNLK